MSQQLLLWCFAAVVPFWEGSFGVSLHYEADAHGILAKLAQPWIPSVPWMLPSALRDSQDLPVCSGGRCIPSVGRGLPLRMCSLPLRHGCLWAPQSHRCLFSPGPAPFLLPRRVPPNPAQQHSPAAMPFVLPLCRTHCHHNDTGCRDVDVVN